MKAHFVRKANKLQDLKGYDDEAATEFVIEEVVYLESEEYENFTENLIDDQEFITKRRDKMYVDAESVWHSILVKVRGADEGILVESEGYDYARYAASYPPTETIEERIRQILAIRETGETNMFDIHKVQHMAEVRGYYELLAFIQDCKLQYCHFILTGEMEPWELSKEALCTSDFEVD